MISLIHLPERTYYLPGLFPRATCSIEVNHQSEYGARRALEHVAKQQLDAPCILQSVSVSRQACRPQHVDRPEQAEAGEHAKRRLALAEAALADLQRSLVAAQAEKHAVELAAQQELQRRGHPQTVRPRAAPQHAARR